jgi:hypothetical protein
MVDSGKAFELATDFIVCSVGFEVKHGIEADKAFGGLTLLWWEAVSVEWHLVNLYWADCLQILLKRGEADGLLFSHVGA